MLLQFPVQLRPDGGVGGSTGTEAPRQDFHIEARAADDKRHPALALKGFDDGSGPFGIAGGIEGFIRIGNIQEVVRD